MGVIMRDGQDSGTVPDHYDTRTVGDPDGYDGALGGLKRRDFLKFCTGVAVTLGLGPGFGIRIADAATKAERPPVIWLSGQACTGCTESLLRTQHPTLESLILDHISLEYHETLNAGAGHRAEQHKEHILDKYRGQYLLIVDGSIPTGEAEAYCMVAGRTQRQSVEEAASGAAAIIATGSCASWGGIPSAAPDPTNARPVNAVVKDKPVITTPGCPANPYNLVSTVLHFLTFREFPEVDDKGRPVFAYGRLIHENCERRAHYDAGRFALEFGDEGHRKGYCLYKLGCKGPMTYANCPVIGFGDVAGEGAWPVGTGHPCFGCTEEGVGFFRPLHSLSDVENVEPPSAYPRVQAEEGEGVTPGAAAVVAGVGGAALGAGAVMTSRLARSGKGDGGDDSAGDDNARE